MIRKFYLFGVLFACNTSSPPVTPAAPPLMEASTLPPAVAARPQSVHYDLSLVIGEGRSSFSIDVSEGAPGSVSFMKNVAISRTARADIGATMKALLVMEGDVPRLELDGAISYESDGKLTRETPHVVVKTPFGAPTVVYTGEKGTRIKSLHRQRQAHALQSLHRQRQRSVRP